MSVMEVKVERSSLTDSMKYDPTTETLTIHFLSTNTTWVYQKVPADVWANLLLTNSVGAFFNKHIRNIYHCERLHGPDTSRAGR